MVYTELENIKSTWSSLLLNWEKASGLSLPLITAQCFVPHVCISQRKPEVETDGRRESKLKRQQEILEIYPPRTINGKLENL